MTENLILGACAGCGNGGSDYIDDTEGFTWHVECFHRWKRHRRTGQILAAVVILTALVVHLILIVRMLYG